MTTKEDKIYKVVFILILCMYALGFLTGFAAKDLLTKQFTMPGYHWIGTNGCWASAPYSIKALEEAKKDCE